MKYVLDASVALKWVLPEADSPLAHELRDAARREVHQFVAPATFPIELAHALTRAERRGILQQGEASVLLADVLMSSPEYVDSLSLLPRAVELSSAFRTGVYDCLYIALAELEDCELLTADARLASTFQKQFRVLMLSEVSGA